MTSKSHANKMAASESHSTESHPAEMSEPTTPNAAAAEARLRGVSPQTKHTETDNDKQPHYEPAGMLSSTVNGAAPAAVRNPV
jgi:hypothetical protein